MTDSGKSAKTNQEHTRSPAHDPVLRAKYLDYCSARVADLLVRLTADEMYLLAQDAARELSPGEQGALSYNEIVRLATDRIARKLALPDLKTWVDEYRRNPDQFERELLGLWKSDLTASGHGVT